MAFFIDPEHTVENQKKLSTLFKQLDTAENAHQYELLLQITKLSLQLKEPDAYAYALQAALIFSDYEVDILLTYLAIKNNQPNDILNYSVKAKNQIKKQFSIFSFEELDIFLSEELISLEYQNILEDLKQDFLSTISENNLSFEEILKKYPENAANIFMKMKKVSGLEEKWPDIENISIKSWEQELSNYKEEIKKQEMLLEKNITFNKEDFILLGRMYLLENQFEKAADCFNHAKNLGNYQEETPKSILGDLT